MACVGVRGVHIIHVAWVGACTWRAHNTCGVGGWVHVRGVHIIHAACITETGLVTKRSKVRRYLKRRSFSISSEDCDNDDDVTGLR